VIKSFFFSLSLSMQRYRDCVEIGGQKKYIVRAENTMHEQEPFLSLYF